MNILLNTNLTKRTKLSLFKGKIIPIILSEKITKIHIITDSKGPYSKKISYHCPPKIISKNGVARLFYRILLSFSVSIKYRPQIYFGFFTIPHGFISVLCSKFFARPSVIYIMGGKREFTEALNFSAKSRFPLGILETPLHSFFTSSDHFVVTGLAGKDYLVKQGHSKYKISVIPSVSKFRIKETVSEKKYDLVTVSRLVPVKRVDFFIEIVYEIKKLKPNLKVCIVGDGDLMQELKDLSIKLNLQDNIFFVGWQEKTHKFFSESKIFVMTSRMEGLPLALIEAMSLGLPSVVPNVGDIGTLSNNGYNSFLVENHDKSVFVSSIIKLLDEKEKYNTFSSNAIKSIKPYTPLSATKKVENIIGKCIKND